MKFRLPTILSAAAIAASALLPQTSFADEGPVVVELYTSQGCSSCPPADKLLGELAKRDNVLPLAFHVDYWDYIGWKDIFGDPKHAKRQRAYAREGNRRVIYTPQMIIAGGQNIEGAHAMKTVDAIRAAEGEGVDVGLRLSRKGDRLTIRADRTNLPDSVSVHLVRYIPEETVKVLRGENRGRTLTYHNVVSSFETLKSWDGRKALNLTTTVKGDDEIAVILQHRGPGQIISAARLN